MREKGPGFNIMPVKINVIHTRVQKVQVKIQRAKWQQYIKY